MLVTPSGLGSASLPPNYKSLVHYLHLLSVSDLLIFLRNLPSWLESHPEVNRITLCSTFPMLSRKLPLQVALLTLSSLSYLFQNSEEMTSSVRNALLEKVKEALTKASASSNLTVRKQLL